MIRDGGGDLFRIMFERSADAILLLDTVPNSFTEYNEAALAMLGCTREELAVLHPSALSPPTQPDGRASFDKANEMIALAVERGSHRFEWVHRSPHREEFWVEVLLTPLQAGPAPLVLVVWREITERRQAEQALREAQRRESLGVLAAGIAHDFNNLLAAVSGHAEMIEVALPPGHRALRHVGHITSAVRRASDLARQMLAYSGRARSRVELVDLSATVAELADLLAVAVPKRVRLVRELADELPRVRADAAQLQQVVLNLVTNAGEAIGDRDGEILVATSVRELDADGIVREFPGQELAPGRYAELVVADTGGGILPEVRAHIFDPFFTTKHTGRGLGLSATLGILRSHHAGYRIDSKLGEGTRFVVCLPVEGARAPAEDAAPLRVRHGDLRGTVLLVDDEDMVRVATREILEFLGAQVIEARAGADAVEVFVRHRGTIAWVLMDLTMPRLDGHEAMLAMRRLDPTIRVVLASGWAGTDLEERFRAEPPDSFLDKPFRAADVVAVYQRIGR